MTNATNAATAHTDNMEVRMMTADDYTPEAYAARKAARAAARKAAGGGTMSRQAYNAAVRANPNATAEQLRRAGWRGPRDL